ncbi:sugar phosphate isomerase/epimerase family protein [Solirubrobacter soli]|uniref:sugar phosphate isomerase/epimerase family protein n=1 Tax=Solirubrobacter soli TaxID=363832 RepID=UPI0004041ED3|nr:TIM barrel protein [Solirubrobacter soli]
MRLGAPLPSSFDSPEGWIELLRSRGFRTAYWPLPDDAGLDEADAYAAAAEAAGISIAEIGAWLANPLSRDDAVRAAGVARCQERLALADRVNARCCVNIAGSFSETWDGPHVEALSADTFALIVDSVREIIDAVAPERTYYTLEPMPYLLPDSPDSYLALLEAVDRDRFAVHLDPVNMINTPAKLYDNAGFLRECFEKLGPHVRAVHAKDMDITSSLTLDMPERRPGTGIVDYRVFLELMQGLDPDTPFLVEHLPSDEEYVLAVAHVRAVADELGVAT